MLGGGYNAYVQLVQTSDYLVLLTEMVHDAETTISEPFQLSDEALVTRRGRNRPDPRRRCAAPPSKKAVLSVTVDPPH
jgi:hypothetical protein